MGIRLQDARLTVRIAVVGSGISGLYAAYYLSKFHDVVLYEKNRRLGGHVHTVPLTERDAEFAVDMGFIVFNRSYYPNFCRLIGELGVASRETGMSFSYKDQLSGLEYSGKSLPSMFAQPGRLLDARHWRLLIDILRYTRTQETEDDLETSIDQFVREQGFSRQFSETFLKPLCSALWSTPIEATGDFSIQFVTRFMRNHGMMQVSSRPKWEVIEGGSATYVDRLKQAANFEVKLNCPVESVTREADSVKVVSGAEVESFDHVVFACHADQALQTLKAPTQIESEILGSFRFEPNEAILHTDVSVLPKNKKAWAAWNYVRCESSKATVTYNMNLLQHLQTKETYLVSLNMGQQIDSQKVICKVNFEHPVASHAAERSKRRRTELISHNRISYCGAYWGNGFHEDGARSAQEVVEALQ